MQVWALAMVSKQLGDALRLVLTCVDRFLRLGVLSGHKGGVWDCGDSRNALEEPCPDKHVLETRQDDRGVQAPKPALARGV